jgi:acyl-coenzyme A thioesterase PaaI-like protein
MNTPLGKEELQQRLAHSAFIDFLNLTVLTADPEKQQVVMRAAMRPEFERGRGTGQWHGGPIARSCPASFATSTSTMPTSRPLRLTVAVTTSAVSIAGRR